MYYYILNECSDPYLPGDTCYYSSLEKAILQMEAIDVINEEYFLFRSDGREIALSVDTNDNIKTQLLEKNTDKVRCLVLADLDRLKNDARFSCKLADQGYQDWSLEKMCEFIVAHGIFYH